MFLLTPGFRSLDIIIYLHSLSTTLAREPATRSGKPTNAQLRNRGSRTSGSTAPKIIILDYRTIQRGTHV